MKALLHKITTSQSGYSALALRIPIGRTALRNCLAGLAATAWKAQDNGWHQLDLALAY